MACAINIEGNRESNSDCMIHQYLNHSFQVKLNANQIPEAEIRSDRLRTQAQEVNVNRHGWHERFESCVGIAKGNRFECDVTYRDEPAKFGGFRPRSWKRAVITRDLERGRTGCLQPRKTGIGGDLWCGKCLCAGVVGCPSVPHGTMIGLVVRLAVPILRSQIVILKPKYLFCEPVAQYNTES
ncbi:uncharacterized protein MELLADRAFT_112397 [Melampsora larici-populina 98AG31]|uniref:Uncharacterized protein n=1 Tax=Melampsora larici-populina (strain 98AG31 / pathotype 3-4-7) TaxID=747676 RepID=F4S6C5_MELLP|nr:uncharacterized protein MELLADRAFT_112397 [Melampsora larici-populina 98AG31]EGF99820.1 hypothetical protein MELLADRAFT_112397 [Melampsora larici-populina 98AG31]